jgi:integrase
MIDPGKLRKLTFEQAAPIWLEAHAPHISPRTRLDYENCIAALLHFFRRLPLAAIHIGHFEQYQQQRAAGAGDFPRAAGASRINHELNTLSQVLDRGGLWVRIASHYHPMRLPKPTVGCALTAEQEERLFRIASSNPRWKVAYCCSVITANTTAGPNEIRNLRIRDVELTPPVIHIVEGVKNEYRRRDIPLNEPARWAIGILLKRAQRIGAVDPDHYLVPHRAPKGAKGFDPTRPISSWRKAWQKLRVVAGMPQLRMYDLRHHIITRLLEDENVSERTVIELAGHVSRAMLDRYSHIRMATKKDALEGLAKKSAASVRAPLLLVKK